ncbi:MAG TPA: threonine synthase [Candidatus Megamonas gallistercoris]|nr:threonine synthase [Candidatus Megamonas gallistercoris]
MEYISTRGGGSPVSAARAIIKGLATDGGLFVPQTIPSIDKEFIHSLLNLSYQERAKKIISLYLTDFTAQEINDCVENAYGHNKFDTDSVVPTVQVEGNNYLLELWHGPTSAFKDMALQLLPQFISTSLKKLGDKNELVILVATSGDTGKAALDGFKNVPQTKIIVFYPQEGVSQIQRLQMLTQEGNNVAVVAVKGNFDDAQNGVKQIFNDVSYNEMLAQKGFQLSSANSINWGRLLPQIVYYFSSYADLINMGKIALGDKVNFTVPTGNFGDILAGFYAKCMGLPVNRLICASNANNVLTDFLMTGTYDRNREFFKTISPSMDILISSNLERLLYHITNDSEKVGAWMSKLQQEGKYTVDEATLKAIQEIFSAGCLNDADTMDCIRNIYDKDGYVADTHTAVAWQVAQDYTKRTGETVPMVILSTASPYKFNDSVLTALGKDITDKDEFALLDELAQINKDPIPQGLARLKTAPVLHGKVCEKQKMQRSVSEFLNI